MEDEGRKGQGGEEGGPSWRGASTRVNRDC